MLSTTVVSNNQRGRVKKLKYTFNIGMFIYITKVSFFFVDKTKQKLSFSILQVQSRPISLISVSSVCFVFLFCSIAFVFHWFLCFVFVLCSIAGCSNYSVVAHWFPKTTTLWIICAPVQQGKGRVNEEQMVWFNKSERLFYLLIISYAPHCLWNKIDGYPRVELNLNLLSTI